ncbi:MAG: EAL domain-containing protein [Gammaproteobacteria bacterium]
MNVHLAKGMTLFRRLWLTVIFTTIVAFIGSFVVSLLTARDYLEQQLYTQSMDNAAALALSMSQQGGDPAMQELLVTALFDSGHFREVVFRDVRGRIVVERRNTLRADSTPAWFTRLFTLQARPGEALVSDGWQQAGKVMLVADTRFAYAALWEGALQLLAWMCLAGLLTGLLGSLLLRAIRRPLDRVVEQADAISERRFITLDVPRIPELKAMVQALNSMVIRLKHMFAEEAARIQALQQQANGDPLTGLANRAWLDSRLEAALSEEDAASHGALLWLHLHELQAINNALGHERCDALLRDMADGWRTALADHHERVAARPAGGEFLLLAPGLDAAGARALGEALMTRLATLLDSQYGLRGNYLHLGIALYHHSQTATEVREQCEQALLAAVASADNAVVVQDVPAGRSEVLPWQSLLEQGLSTHGFFLQAFPVVHADDAPLHDEMTLRLRHPDTGAALPAGHFMPFATRHGLTPALDLETCRLALALLREAPRALALNLSIESVQSGDFLDRLVALLSAEPDLARHLWFEISEHGLGGELQLLRQLTQRLRPLSCRVGIDHFGRHFSSLPHLHDLGLDYLKIDSSLIAGIDDNPGNRAVVKAIASIAGSLDLLSIAERVQTPAERVVLAELGVSGLTGPVLAG